MNLIRCHIDHTDDVDKNKNVALSCNAFCGGLTTFLKQICILGPTAIWNNSW